MRTGFTGYKRAALPAMAAVAAASIVGLTGVASAGAAPIAQHAAAVTGTEHFQLMTTSATATTIDVIVWGVFTGAGVDHEGSTVDTVVLPGGTFKVRHPGGGGPGSVNPKTCLLTASERSGVSFFGGTGKFKGLSGKGTATVSIVAIAAKSKGACSETLPPLAFQQVIAGAATVKLP